MGSQQEEKGPETHPKTILAGLLQAGLGAVRGAAAAEADRKEAALTVLSERLARTGEGLRDALQTEVVERRAEAQARPSLIPSLCTTFTRAGIEWRRCHHAVCMTRPCKEPHHSGQAEP